MSELLLSPPDLILLCVLHPQHGHLHMNQLPHTIIHRLHLFAHQVQVELLVHVLHLLLIVHLVSLDLLDSGLLVPVTLHCLN